MADEVWRPAPDPLYAPFYEVSDRGRVRISGRRRGSRFHHLLKPHTGKVGYPFVVLSANNVPKTFYVHRLVAVAFLGEPGPGHEVNHRDGCKTNPVLENLEWTTQSGNSRHAYRTGLNRSGQTHEWAKLSDVEATSIRRGFAAGRRVADLAGEYEVSWGAIKRIVTRRVRKNQDEAHHGVD